MAVHNQLASSACAVTAVDKSGTGDLAGDLDRKGVSVFLCRLDTRTAGGRIAAEQMAPRCLSLATCFRFRRQYPAEV